jgi:hypothetical protein
MAHTNEKRLPPIHAGEVLLDVHQEASRRQTLSP